MQSIPQDTLINPYLRRYLSQSERATDLTPRAMEYHVKSFSKSGLTQIEYCRVNRLSYSKLVCWLKKARNQAKNMQTPQRDEPATYQFEEPQYRYETELI